MVLFCSVFGKAFEVKCVTLCPTLNFAPSETTEAKNAQPPLVFRNPLHSPAERRYCGRLLASRVRQSPFAKSILNISRVINFTRVLITGPK